MSIEVISYDSIVTTIGTLMPFVTRPDYQKIRRLTNELIKAAMEIPCCQSALMGYAGSFMTPGNYTLVETTAWVNPTQPPITPAG